MLIFFPVDILRVFIDQLFKLRVFFDSVVTRLVKMTDLELIFKLHLKSPNSRTIRT